MAVVLSVLLGLAGGSLGVHTHPPARVAGEVVTFTSPSRNIACGLHDGSARCDIRQKDWRPPPQPRWCRNLDWGFGLTVDRRGPGHFVCAGDSVFGTQKVLPYGQSIEQGPIRCVMRVSGVHCLNTRSGHGFLLSKEKARPF
jgi:hypothetical protein